MRFDGPRGDAPRMYDTISATATTAGCGRSIAREENGPATPS